MDDYNADFEKKETSWNVVNLVFNVLENYGWHLLICLIVFAVIYQKTLKSYLQKYKAHKLEAEYAAKYSKNPDMFAAHVNAQQEWIQKMQEKYNMESERYQIKIKEKKEKKLEELKEKYGSSNSGYTLGTGKDGKSKGLREDYNPLTGSGNSSTYRPTRRSPCGGGGCGR